jgi:hypothetical protein
VTLMPSLLGTIALGRFKPRKTRRECQLQAVAE